MNKKWVYIILVCSLIFNFGITYYSISLKKEYEQTSNTYIQLSNDYINRINVTKSFLNNVLQNRTTINKEDLFNATASAHIASTLSSFFDTTAIKTYNTDSHLSTVTSNITVKINNFNINVLNNKTITQEDWDNLENAYKHLEILSKVLNSDAFSDKEKAIQMLKSIPYDQFSN
ncbi:hypothetical protein [Robertmurraya sp.]|uniref:hypothetical protein n=1 Tax=Robertmurraya sp. TaxID=2837525 RepID=UPI00370464E2